MIRNPGPTAGQQYYRSRKANPSSCKVMVNALPPGLPNIGFKEPSKALWNTPGNRRVPVQVECEP